MKTKIWIMMVCIQVGLIGMLFRYTYAHNELIITESINYVNKLNQHYKVEKEFIESSVLHSNFNSKNYGEDFQRAVYDLKLDELIKDAKEAMSKEQLLVLRQALLFRVSMLDPFYVNAELKLDIDNFSFRKTDVEVLKEDFINLVFETKAYLLKPILFPHLDSLS